MTLGMYTGNRNKTDTGLMFFMRLDRERGIKRLSYLSRCDFACVRPSLIQGPRLSPTENSALDSQQHGHVTEGKHRLRSRNVRVPVLSRSGARDVSPFRGTQRSVLTTRPSSRGSREDCMMSGGTVREKGLGKLQSMTRFLTFASTSSTRTLSRGLVEGWRKQAHPGRGIERRAPAP